MEKEITVYRIREKDTKTVSTISGGKIIEPSSETDGTTYFGLLGRTKPPKKKTLVEKDNDICAAITKHGNKTEYYVKGTRATLFNPQNPRKYIWKMQRVNKPVFDAYFKFLTTLTTRFLRVAEKRFTNA